jgi:hypothetical protein
MPDRFDHDAQHPDDIVEKQDSHQELIDETIDGVTAENVAIATPASPGASYVQAEVVALRTAIASILTALRNSGIIPT